MNLRAEGWDRRSARSAVGRAGSCAAASLAGIAAVRHFVDSFRRCVLFGLTAAALLAGGCSPAHQKTVVVYTSQDPVYAEPILDRFTQETGVEVRPVFDSEAVKTVALAGRLLAERGHPQCDVFWNNERMQTEVLAARDVFSDTDAVRVMGFRSRRVVINTNLVDAGEAPTRLFDLTNAVWKGKVAVAYPLFGTTFLHFAALRQRWGDARWRIWCEGLVANAAMVVDGNSVVVRQVGAGEAAVGLTDSDDVAAGTREGLPIAALPLTDESLLIPNTVAVTRDSPHPEAARQLAEFLSRSDVIAQLVSAGALEGTSPDHLGVATLEPDWTRLVAEHDETAEILRRIFLR